MTITEGSGFSLRHAAILQADLERLMPGCDVYVSGRLTAELVGWATHRVTGRRLTVVVTDGGHEVHCGTSHHSGTTAYGFDSAVVHEYRHQLDFTAEHGPGTAWGYAQHGVSS